MSDVKKNSVFSMCGMCAVRCPMQIDVEEDRVTWVQGNHYDPSIGTSLCAKGVAGIAFEYDNERLQTPMIRTGKRGEGKWKNVSWNEALTYISDKLKSVTQKYGAKGIVLSDRSGPFTDLTKTFIKALGSPNYFSHDSSCASNTNHAAKTLFALGRGGITYDLKNTKHIVLYGRNLLESLQVGEAKAFMAALNSGAKCTYIDMRNTLTAEKATRFWRIKPGSDYALNLAIIREIIEQGYYDKKFVETWTEGFESISRSVQKHTLKWAEQQTGISAESIRLFVKEIAQNAPHVIFHGGWMTARHTQSFYVARSTYIIGVLLGAVEAKGGYILAKTPKDAGYGNLNKLLDQVPAVTAPRVDGAGTTNKLLDPNHGLLQLMYSAIKTEKPYHIGAYIAYRHDPLSGFPDPEEQKKLFDKLDLVVSIDVNYSETAWNADVILPESTYFERSNILAQRGGGKPSIAIRQQAIEPRFDSKPAWWIFRELLKRMEKGQYLDFDSIEDIWNFQLKDTRIPLKELREKGVFFVTNKPILFDRNNLKFATSSHKIELISRLLTEMGIDSLPDYKPFKPLNKGEFRLTFGRTGQLAHAQATNNYYLSEMIANNPVWINPEAAKSLNISDGDEITIVSKKYHVDATVFVTERITPDIIFMLHGFGRTVPRLTRAFNKGIADQRLEVGGLDHYDPVGGGFAKTETIVTIQPR